MKLKWVLLFLLIPTAIWAHRFNCCGSGPLYCGAWSVAARAGGVPSSYSLREPIWGVIPTGAPSVVQVGRMSRFSHQFHLPWEVDGELALNLSQRVQPFLQYQFQQGGGKRHIAEVDHSFSRYQTHAGYLGCRYYYAGICSPCLGRIAPFLGFKTGLMWRRHIDELLSVGGAPAVRFRYSSKRVAISGGLQVGVEWWFTWYWSAIFQVDGVATASPKTRSNLPFNPPLANRVTNLNFSSSGAILSFPITAGMRFAF